MQLTLDKNLDSERSLEIDFINERPLNNTLSGSRSIDIAEKEPFPDTEKFGEKKSFSTIEIVRDGELFPTSGKYNVILDYSVQFNDINRLFTVSVVFGWEEPHDE